MHKLEEILIKEILKPGMSDIKLPADKSYSASSPYKIYNDFFQPNSDGTASDCVKLLKKLIGYIDTGTNKMSDKDENIIYAAEAEILALQVNSLGANEAAKKLNTIVNILKKYQLNKNTEFLEEYNQRPSIAKTASTGSFGSQSSFRSPSTDLPAGATIEKPKINQKTVETKVDIPLDTVIYKSSLFKRPLDTAGRNPIIKVSQENLGKNKFDILTKANEKNQRMVKNAEGTAKNDTDAQRKQDRKDVSDFFKNATFESFNEQTNKDGTTTIFTNIFDEDKKHILTHEITDLNGEWTHVRYRLGNDANKQYNSQDPLMFDKRLLILEFIAEQAVKINKLLSLGDECKDVVTPGFFIKAEGEIDDAILMAYFLMFHQCIIPVFGDQTEKFKERITELVNKEENGQLDDYEEKILAYGMRVKNQKGLLGGDKLFDKNAEAVDVKQCVEANLSLVKNVYEPATTDPNFTVKEQQSIAAGIRKAEDQARDTLRGIAIDTDKIAPKQLYNGQTEIFLPDKTVTVSVKVPGTTTQVDLPKKRLI